MSVKNTIETEIYQILESIIDKNMRIQSGEQYSQAEKDNAMRIANASLDMPEEYLSETAINKALVQEYRNKRQ